MIKPFKDKIDKIRFLFEIYEVTGQKKFGREGFRLYKQLLFEMEKWRG